MDNQQSALSRAGAQAALLRLSSVPHCCWSPWAWKLWPGGMAGVPAQLGEAGRGSADGAAARGSWMWASGGKGVWRRREGHLARHHLCPPQAGSHTLSQARELPQNTI